jgi:hypothetical protein
MHFELTMSVCDILLFSRECMHELYFYNYEHVSGMNVDNNMSANNEADPFDTVGPRQCEEFLQSLRCIGEDGPVVHQMPSRWSHEELIQMGIPPHTCLFCFEEKTELMAICKGNCGVFYHPSCIGQYEDEDLICPYCNHDKESPEKDYRFSQLMKGLLHHHRFCSEAPGDIRYREDFRMSPKWDQLNFGTRYFVEAETEATQPGIIVCILLYN